MSQSGGQTIPYARGNGWQATELRYRGADGTTPLAMTLILPDDLAVLRVEAHGEPARRGSPATLESERERLAAMTEVDVRGDRCWLRLHTPTPSSSSCLASAIETKAILAGRPEVAGHAASPSPAERPTSPAIHVPKSYEEILYIGDVIHQANIDVDEKGTEAAAATAVGMETTGGGCGSSPAPRKTITLRLDHPFLFVLRDVETGAVLFMGRVVDPSVGR